MQYMLLLFADEKEGARIAPADMAKVMEQMGSYGDALKKAGAFVMTGPLGRTHEAKTIRMHGGETVQAEPGKFVNETGELKVHDGPYAETREQLGGFYIIEAKDMDEALDWAKKCPAAQWGPIEVRAILSGL